MLRIMGSSTGRFGLRGTWVVGAIAACVLLAGMAGPAAAATGSVLPDGFRAQSLSFVSAERGWILGSVPCGNAECSTVLGTTDGGGSWHVLGSLGAPISQGEDARGIEEVRFADSLHGWAFLPALWDTSDGGVTWRRRTPPGGHGQVLALDGDAQAVYAVVSPCTFNQPCDDPATLWRTTPGSRSWTQVPVRLRHTSLAEVAVLEAVAYVAIPTIDSGDPDQLFVTLDGAEWHARPDPCRKAYGESLMHVAPIAGTQVAMLCVAPEGFGKAEKRVFRSRDTGKTTSPAGTLSEWGINSELAAAPDGTLVVSSYSISSWIYRNAGGTTWTTPVDGIDLGEGWNDFAFTSNSTGFVIHAPAFCCGEGGVGELGATFDGGMTWAPV